MNNNKMEETNLNQTIDQPSTSSIDQITKIPDPKSTPKVKNPKRVAAGKKLHEYNKRAKEQQKAVEKNEEEPVENEESSSFFPATTLTTIITLIGLGLTALDLFLRYKGQQNKSNSKIWDGNAVNYNDIDSEKDLNENNTEMKIINPSKSFGGME